MPVSEIVPTMMPMTPSVAPMIRVLLAPVWIASQISRGPIRVSLRTQLTAMHDSVAQNAELPGDRPMTISTVMITSGSTKYHSRLRTTVQCGASASISPWMLCFFASKWIMQKTEKK